MEIRVKTHEEFRTDRVTIEITGTGAEIRQDGNYPTELDWAAVRAERDLFREKLAHVEGQYRLAQDVIQERDERVTELEAQIDRLTKGHVCTPACQPNAHVAFIGHHRLAELETELAKVWDRHQKSTARVAELERHLRESNERRYKDVLARDQEADQRVSVRDRLLEECITKIENARTILSAPKVSEVRGDVVTSKGVILADTIGKALGALA
jgi:hypothetical protein